MTEGKGAVERQVTLRADSDHTLNEMESEIERRRIQIEGGWGAKLTNWADRSIARMGRFFETVGRPIFDLLSYALMAVGAVMAWVAASRLFPVEALGEWFTWIIGGVGAIVVIGMKVSAGRWAKAQNDQDPEEAKFWRNAVVAGLAVSLLFGISFQAAVTSDSISGVSSIDDALDDNDRLIRTLRMETMSMDVPRASAAALEREISLLKGKEATNEAGARTGKTVAEWIDDGTDSYCRGTSWYKMKHCEDIIALETDLEDRRAYDAKLAQIEQLMQTNADLRASKPKSSSGAAVAGVLGGEQSWVDKLRAVIAGALLISVIEILMVWMAYVAKRQPKPKEIAA